jgi:hypothetical protein
VPLALLALGAALLVPGIVGTASGTQWVAELMEGEVPLEKGDYYLCYPASSTQPRMSARFTNVDTGEGYDTTPLAGTPISRGSVQAFARVTIAQAGVYEPSVSGVFDRSISRLALYKPFAPLVGPVLMMVGGALTLVASLVVTLALATSRSTAAVLLSSVPGPISPRSRRTAVTLALIPLTGWLGIHRMYMGRWISGFAQLFTLGGVLAWWVIDIVVLARGKMKDGRGRVVMSRRARMGYLQRPAGPAPLSAAMIDAPGLLRCS